MYGDEESPHAECRERIAELEGEVARMQGQLDQIADATTAAMDERCDASERHCTCVPLLRVKVEGLRTQLRTLANEVCCYHATGKAYPGMVLLATRAMEETKAAKAAGEKQ